MPTLGTAAQASLSLTAQPPLFRQPTYGKFGIPALRKTLASPPTANTVTPKYPALGVAALPEAANRPLAASTRTEIITVQLGMKKASPRMQQSDGRLKEEGYSAA